MTLHIHTAPFNYRGPDRLDITRKSGGAAGLPFAPSWRILGPALKARQRADAIRKLNPADTMGPALLEDAAWSDYYPRYFAEMRASLEVTPLAWDALFARERVVLVCYCPTRERCHRGLLAGMLADMGAVDLGELPRTTPTTETP